MNAFRGVKQRAKGPTLANCVVILKSKFYENSMLQIKNLYIITIRLIGVVSERGSPEAMAARNLFAVVRHFV